jgi:DNA modification methylase
MTTGVAALGAGRRFVGVELNPGYAAAGAERLVSARAI